MYFKIISLDFQVLHPVDLMKASRARFCICLYVVRLLRGPRIFMGKIFWRVRKISKGFVMSVRSSVPTEELGSHWTDFG